VKNGIAIHLLELNRRFYDEFGQSFSATRRRIQPGVRQILSRLKGNETILDLGCGNGELARLLARKGHTGSYLGLDLSLPLLADTPSPPGPFRAAFIQADLSTDWEKQLPQGNSENAHDLIFCFAVLHHIPSQVLRLDILGKIKKLLKPGGHFVHSEWQFLNSERLRARIQPWEQAGLSEADVDPGDYLLDWRHCGNGLRYVHHFSEDELNELARQAGFTVINTFYSDGENNRLGLYQTWQAA
jgi:tRNA (uracil-5-)-methyltransferase TRM9